MPTMTPDQIQALVQTYTAQGTVPKQYVTAVHIKGCEWTPIQPGSFELCQINFVDVVTQKVTAAGVVGFRFITAGLAGRSAYVFVTMENLAAVQLEQPEVTEGQ